MRHIIGILLQNESGALSRVAGLFSSRGYNIESLSVAATDDPTVSRITLVTTGSEAVIHQIVSQLNKLIDVVRVDDMTRDEHLERELVLVKLRVDPRGATRCAATSCAPAGGCSIRPPTASSSNCSGAKPRSTTSFTNWQATASCSRSCAAAHSASAAARARCGS